MLKKERKKRNIPYFHIKTDYMGEIEKAYECRGGEPSFRLQLAFNPEAVELNYI